MIRSDPNGADPHGSIGFFDFHNVPGGLETSRISAHVFVLQFGVRNGLPKA